MRYLKDPKVYVSVKQYNSRTFFIQGAVRSPGVYVISGKPTLFKLMTIAGRVAGEPRRDRVYLPRSETQARETGDRRAERRPKSS